MSRQERAKKAHQVKITTEDSDFEQINEIDSLPVTPNEQESKLMRTSAIKIEAPLQIDLDAEHMEPKKLLQL